jgi:hypothetical protein
VPSLWPSLISFRKKWYYEAHEDWLIKERILLL